jgi:hypothetical protein
MRALFFRAKPNAHAHPARRPEPPLRREKLLPLTRVPPQREAISSSVPLAVKADRESARAKVAARPPPCPPPPPSAAPGGLARKANCRGKPEIGSWRSCALDYCFCSRPGVVRVRPSRPPCRRTPASVPYPTRRMGARPRFPHPARSLLRYLARQAAMADRRWRAPRISHTNAFPLPAGRAQPSPEST